MPIITPEKAVAAWRKAEIERRFWQRHWQQYLEKYRDQFVAVKDERVIAAQPDLRALTADLQAQGIDPPSVSIRFVTPEPRPLLL